MSKYEAMFHIDTESFCVSWFFGEIVQFGVFGNIFLSQLGVV